MAEDQQEEDRLSVKFQHAGRTHTASLRTSSTLQDLSDHIAATLGIPEENQKFLMSPKPGMIKPPFTYPEQSSVLVSDLLISAKKITLLGSTPSQISSLNQSAAKGAAQANRKIGDGPVKAAKPERRRDWKTLQDEIKYTFHEIKPLDYLPFPDKSVKYLERLRDDPGIKAAMIKHQWSVPLLTELNPAENTTQESRTLGLNQNKGQTILLRLRTDDYDGYRDYKTVRDCLCHELAHNVHGEHNREFYDLMKQIQDEVKQNDWKHGGKALSNSEFYEPTEEDDKAERDWIGGDRRLGSASNRPISRAEREGDSAQTRRELMARAAAERAKKTKDSESQEGK